MRKLLYLFAMLCATMPAWAQMSPVGQWRSIDDATGQAKAEIHISQDAQGVLTGVIAKVINGTGATTCEPCTDDRKGKPIVGLEIIRGAKQTAGQNLWEGGSILDPENGKTYTLKMTPLDGGSKLQVRGYIGPFYRTQVWQRLQ